MNKFLPGVLLLSAVLSACAVAGTYTFKANLGLKDEHGVELYVDDRAFIAAIPSLNTQNRRLVTCINNMFFPAAGYIEFSPTVTAPHLAKANRFICQLAKPESLVCSEPSEADRKVAYDDDPAHYFHLDRNTDLAEAREIFRAFERKEVIFASNKRPWITDLPLRSISKSGAGYEVSFSDCGCSERMIVERAQSGTQRQVRVVKVLNGICI